MQISIEVDSWHQAHHLGCILSDAEYAFQQEAADWREKHQDDAVSKSFEAYARFFRSVAKEVTRQAKVLNAYSATPASAIK